MYSFFRQSDLPPLVEMTVSLTCRDPPHPPVRMQLQSQRVTGLCLYRLPGLWSRLVGATDRTRCCYGRQSGRILAVPSWSALAHSVFICTPGFIRTISVCAASLGSMCTFLSCLSSGYFCRLSWGPNAKGDRQENARWSVDRSLLVGVKQAFG